MIFDFQLEAVGVEAQPHPRAIGARMPRDVVQRFLQHAVHVNADGASTARRAGPLVRSTAMPSLPFDGRQIPVDGALEAGSSRIDGMQRLRQSAHVVERGLRDLAGSRAARSRAASPRAHALPARPSIDPIAVRIWPNSSCSSREISRSVDSRVAISCLRELAAFVRERRQLARTAGGSIESGRGSSATIAASVAPPGTSRPAAAPGCRSPAPAAAVCSSASLFSTSSRATAVLERGLPRLERQPDLRRGLPRSLAASRQREDPVDRIPELSHRSRSGTGAAPAFERATATASSRASASSRSTRMRSNCADQAVSGYGSSLSSMSRMASPSEFRSFWMRSSCSESWRLRSARSVCRTRRPEICLVIYHASIRMAASVMTSPTSNPVVGDDRRTREGYHAAMRFRRLACALLAAVLASAALLSRNPVSAQFDLQTLRIMVVSSRDQAERLMERVRTGADFAALARAESIDPSAVDGGLLGRIAISTLRPDLQTALRGLTAGQMTAIVQVPTGFAFIRVEHDSNQTGPTRPLSQALLATGSVKYVIDVGGLPEAETVLREYAKPAAWNLDPRTICQTPRRLAGGRTSTLRRLLLAAHGGGSKYAHAVRVDAGAPGFGATARVRGRPLERAAPFPGGLATRDHAACPTRGRRWRKCWRSRISTRRKWTTALYRAPGDLCLIPTPPGRSLAKTDDVEKAIEHLLNYLQQKPDELEVRWLLNLAYMMVGKYPDGVPPRYLIPPSAFASTEDVGRFVDVAPQAGLNVFASAGGVIVDDLRRQRSIRRRHLEFLQLRSAALFQQQRRRHLRRAHRGGGPERPGRRPEYCADRLQQRRLQRHARAAWRMGSGATQLVAEEQLQRNVYRRHRGRRIGHAR